MSTGWWIRGYRAAFGSLTLFAIVYQLGFLSGEGRLNAGNYFSFFTIQSNIIAALVLLWGAGRDQERRNPETVDLIRGAATLYMSITGLVVFFLLRGTQEDLSVPLLWVDSMVHQVIPIVMVLDWLIVPPSTRIPFRRALVWTIYPMVYAGYSLIRGPIVDWYPYPFLNPNRVSGGYWGVAGYCVGIAVGAVIFTWIVLQVGEWRRSMRGEPAMTAASSA